ncbi:MAG: response regulator [Bacteroidetes bacterium]|jgi:PAS domain S-box-containing protein|nr:response regulator [Bacteroidota bacterium]MBT6687908.1 response regulator [Bacteroidota bacterium]MBT7142444.1 response regulator [Bacteroidota bacterium]MBT7490049.1 response regulator [Bacteroidota bacterium]
MLEKNEIKILVVEDDYSQSLLIKTILTKEGFQVKVIEDGFDAYNYLIENPEKHDIILLDYHLPSIDGLEILQKLDKNNKSLPIIFFTVDSSVDNALKAMKAGAIDFLPKDMTLIDELPLKIEKVYKIYQGKLEKQRMQESIERSEKNYKNLVEYSPNGIVILKDNKLVYSNKKFLKYLRVNFEDIKTLSFIDLIAKEDIEDYKNTSNEINFGSEIPFLEIKLINPKSKESIELEYKMSPLNYNGEQVLQIIFKDISVEKKLLQEKLRAKTAEENNAQLLQEMEIRKTTEKKLRQTIYEKKILFKELHHRVKNNMQIISSILNLQLNTIDDPLMAKLFEESQDRIKSMSLVHENIYKTKNVDKINFKEYVKTLITNLFHSYTMNSSVSFNNDIEDIFLSIDLGVPCGLIINEIVSNSMKYAFANKPDGIVYISLKKLKNKNLELIISDNGIGVSNDLNIEESETLGLQIVSALVSQIDGEIEIDNSNGTKFTIIFKDKI